MSTGNPFAEIERDIVARLRTELNNPKLRLKDLLEWSTGPVKPGDGEISLSPLPGTIYHVTVPAVCDKRVKSQEQ